MTPTPFPFEHDSTGPFGGILTFRLEQPGRAVVVLDEALIQRIDATLDAIPGRCVGLVMASASERVFVAGADLKSISELDEARLDRYLAYGQRVFGRLSQLPFPTIAAINGAALGGGLELAMHCDGLVAAPSASGKPYPIGLPEAGLSLCPGWGGTNLLPARMDPGEAIRCTATGTPMKFDQASKAGLFDAIAPSADALLETAKRWVADRAQHARPDRDGAPSCWIGRSDTASRCVAALDDARPDLPTTGAARAVAEAVNAGLTQGWQAGLDCERRHLVHLSRAPEGVAAIHAFFERAAAKS